MSAQMSLPSFTDQAMLGSAIGGQVADGFCRFSEGYSCRQLDRQFIIEAVNR